MVPVFSIAADGKTSETREDDDEARREGEIRDHGEIS